MLLVPRTDVQLTILVPWEGIALRTILGPLECQYGTIVGNCLPLILYLDFIFLQVISGLDIAESLVPKESLFA